MHDLTKVTSMVLLAFSVHATAFAIESEDISIHGYGHQSYLHSADNTYLKADSQGTWTDNDLALLFTAKIDDKSKIWMQLYGSSDKIRLDWAFVDYQLSNNLTAKVGQIKTPIGLYNEIRDIRFLQVTSLQPLMYQEGVDIMHEAYNGVAFVYKHGLGNGSLTWDVYGGQEVDFEGSTSVKNRRLTGGRVTYKTPFNGLSFMLSAYRNNHQTIATLAQGAQKFLMFSVDYNNNDWNIKSEYANVDNELNNIKGKSYYLQAGYTFAEKWTPYARYDYITTDNDQSADPSYYQNSNTLGLGYKINNSINMRVENHWNKGYAMPVASTEVTAGAGKTDWNMFAASVNFIF
jgi:hypothetical protein